MKVVEFDRGPDKADLQRTLDVVEAMRQAVLEGRVIAFAAVSLNDTDDVESWTGATRSVSRLRIQGAVAHLQHCLHTGDA
jgi:hypothetical protein